MGKLGNRSTSCQLLSRACIRAGHKSGQNLESKLPMRRFSNSLSLNGAFSSRGTHNTREPVENPKGAVTGMRLVCQGRCVDTHLRDESLSAMVQLHPGCLWQRFS